MNNKVVKGQYGYIKRQRRKVIIRTFLMFALSLTLFLTGIWSTGSKKNWLTVVAILGCLPASRSAVNMIMFIRAKGCSEQAHEVISGHSAGLEELYDLVFTSYEKNYQISHMIIKDNVVCGYTEEVSCDVKACEKHLDTFLKQGGCKGVTVKVFKDIEKYCEGLENLRNRQTAEKQKEEDIPEESENILCNLLAIAL